MTKSVASGSRPLVVCLPGSFDSAGYASYRSWLTYLPELGVDVRTLDMLQLPGVKQIEQNNQGPIYFCDWQPEDYFNLIESTIDTMQPSRVVLLGFGFGAYEAMRSAFALSKIGKPVTGVVGITPHSLQYSTDAYREEKDLPKNPLAELRERIGQAQVTETLQGRASQLLSCVRYEDLRRPHNGAKTTFYMPKQVIQRYRYPGSQQYRSRVETFRQDFFANTSEVLRTPHYTTPTALIAASESWYLPSARVSALARRSKRAQTSYSEVPGVCYDFRAYPSQVERVTEMVMDKVGQLISTGTVRQPRPSHSMLVRPRVVTEQPMNTIVLSSARPPKHHRDAIRLAKASHADLIVLGSHELNQSIVASDMEKSSVRGCVIDIPNDFNLPLMRGFATNMHLHVADRKGNLSAKRNIGLLYGHLTGRRVFFIDDDIRKVTARELRNISAQLNQQPVASFLASAYPDNSVVCYANRLAGGSQEIFITGGALGVDAVRTRSFFPNVYNEDWLFCIDALVARNVALLGTVKQLPYNPFKRERAIAEEFGDVLAEGMSYMLASGAPFENLTESFWQYYLWRRRMFIANIARRLALLPDQGDDRVPQALVALDASKEELVTYTPLDLVTYIQAWRDDIGRWRNLIDALPRDKTPWEAIRHITQVNGLKSRLVGNWTS